MVVIKTVVSFYLFILIINYITADTNASFTSNNEVNISIDAWVEEQEDTDATGDQLEQDENNPDGENSNQDKENQSETNTVKPERQVNETNEGDSAQADFNKKANEDHANSTEQKQASQSAATLNVPRSLFTTKVARASPSMSSAIINNGFDCCNTCSSKGRIS